MGRKSYIALPVQINHWMRCMTQLCIMGAITSSLREKFGITIGEWLLKVIKRATAKCKWSGHFWEERAGRNDLESLSPLFHLTAGLMNNRRSESMVAGVMCVSECTERFDYFYSEKMTLFSLLFFHPLWQTSLRDLPALLGHSADQWITTFIPFLSRRSPPLLWASQSSLDRHVLRCEELEAWICWCWAALGAGRVRPGRLARSPAVAGCPACDFADSDGLPFSHSRGQFMEIEAGCLNGTRDDHCLVPSRNQVEPCGPEFKANVPYKSPAFPGQPNEN